jgi:AbrB family looped-hinge helix DNA binding protein
MIHRKGAIHTLVLGDRGRLVFPAAVRKAVGLEPGDRLLLHIEEDGSIRLEKLSDQLARMRGILRPLSKGRVLSEELIAERRREAERE